MSSVREREGLVIFQRQARQEYKFFKKIKSSEERGSGVLNSNRLIAALIVLPFLTLFIYFLPPIPYFLALLVIVCMLALREFYTMYKVPDILYMPGIFIGGILFYVSCRHPAYFLDGIFISLFLLLIIRLLSVKSPSGAMSEIGPLGVGFFYIAGFLNFQWFLRTDVLGREYIFLLYTSVWLADSAAFYVGTYLGKKKLYPSVSPNKTFEGLIGSLVGGVLGAFIVDIVFRIPDLSTKKALIVGAVLGSTAVLGDLIESMFKRDAGVKDSGSLIPGHGGLLDKIDGLLISGPILYIILRYL
jgi:phosphatidate cytidylyltransferase